MTHDLIAPAAACLLAILCGEAWGTLTGLIA